ncbi:MAG: flagellar basal body rod protein FlgB [Lachnospiraceae bacterium]|nr:flagellar basal body rod protein FlgB [Lachnospiraceae bacterium]MBR1876687.1 flagellar basal body rod protein FlgB [Lachnospiraceae bacterium]
MINSGIYNYIDVLDKAMDASALRSKAIANNIANVDTPHYKRQDVSFAENLQRALKNSKFETLDDKVSSLKLSRLKGTVFTDSEGYSYRLDGNNVDIDTENVQMAANQLLYNGLEQSVNSEFQHFQAVTK